MSFGHAAESTSPKTSLKFLPSTLRAGGRFFGSPFAPDRFAASAASSYYSVGSPGPAGDAVDAACPECLRSMGIGAENVREQREAGGLRWRRFGRRFGPLRHPG